VGIRDTVILAVYVLALSAVLYDSYYGMLAYSVLSFMRPQSLAWHPEVRGARIILLLAILLLSRVLLMRESILRWRAPTVTFLLLWVWFGISSLKSADTDLSLDAFVQFSKMAAPAMLITGLVRTRHQLKWLMIMLACCPAIWAIKFGLFFALTGVTSQVHDAGIAGMDNNDMAMFIAMGIPLLVFATCELKPAWARLGFVGATGLAVLGVILTASRGGMVALAVALFSTIWRRLRWWKAILCTGVVLAATLAVIPQDTLQRYWTIGAYEQDGSAMRRIECWKTCKAMADANLAGVGFGQDVYLKEYPKYSVRPETAPRAAHSVWFSLMAESGYIGFGLYVCMLMAALWSTQRTASRFALSKGGDGGWAWNYAIGLQCVILSFAAGGTFLSQARFEFVFALCMAAVPLACIGEEESEHRRALPRSVSCVRAAKVAAAL